MADAPKRQYGAINGLRAIAALGILFFHTSGKYMGRCKLYYDDHPARTYLDALPDLAFLFMLISGFVLCCGYFEKYRRGELDPGAFYGKRFRRVFPFFALVCVADFVMDPSLSTLGELGASLTLCFGLLPLPKMSVVGIGWFVGVLFVFYLLFPFFCYLLSRPWRAWLSFGVALVLHLLCREQLLVPMEQIEGYGMRHSILFCSVFFLAGGLIYLYREVLTRLAKKVWYLLLPLAAGGIWLYFIADKAEILCLIPFSLLLILALGHDRMGPLKNPLTDFLGEISMEIYLCQMGILELFERLGMHMWFENPWFSMVVLFCLAFLAACCVAVVYRWAERQCVRLLEELKRRRTASTSPEEPES